MVKKMLFKYVKIVLSHWEEFASTFAFCLFMSLEI